MAAHGGMTPLQQAEQIQVLLDQGHSVDDIRRDHEELAEGWDHLAEVALGAPAGAGPLRLDSRVVPL